MRVIVANFDNDILTGIASSLTSVGVEVLIWNKNTKPVIDVFDETHPDIFICQSSDVDAAMHQCLQENQHTKLVLFGIHTPMNISPAIMCYPDSLKDEHIKMLNTKNTPYIKLMPAANWAKYCNGKSGYDSDCLFISDMSVLPEGMKWLVRLSESLKVRIVGPTPSPLVNYVGPVPLPILCNMMKSTLIGLDIGGNHYYNYSVNKTVPLTMSNTAPEIFPRLTEENVIKYLLSSKAAKNRKNTAKELYDYTVNNHTYFHRTKELMDRLDLSDISEKVMAMHGVLLNAQP